MPNQVNLLPTEKKAKPQLIKLSRTLKKFVVVFAAMVLVAVLGFVVLYFVLSFQLRNEKEELADLKTRVSALQQTEQGLYLLKDRLAKIDKIRSEKNVYQDMPEVEEINNMLSDEVVLEEVEVESGKISLALGLKDSSQVKGIIKKILDTRSYSEVTLSSLDSDANLGGYKAEFLLIK